MGQENEKIIEGGDKANESTNKEGEALPNSPKKPKSTGIIKTLKRKFNLTKDSEGKKSKEEAATEDQAEKKDETQKEEETAENLNLSGGSVEVNGEKQEAEEPKEGECESSTKKEENNDEAQVSSSKKDKKLKMPKVIKDIFAKKEKPVENNSEPNKEQEDRKQENNGEEEANEEKEGEDKQTEEAPETAAEETPKQEEEETPETTAESKPKKIQQHLQF